MAWQVAALGSWTQPASWQVMTVEAESFAPPPAPPLWDIVKLSGDATTLYYWRVAKLSGAFVKIVPKWSVHQLQARTTQVNDGYLWAYLSGEWQRARMFTYLSGGWYSLEPEDN